MKRRKRKSVSRIVKTVPLSIALAALSAGPVFAADAEYDHIQVELNDGKVYEFDLGLASTDAVYAAQVKTQLSAAFEDGRSILVQVGKDEWLEFGENASADLTLAGIKGESDKYAGTPDANAEIILPSPY
jgi:hypothetical protein